MISLLDALLDMLQEFLTSKQNVSLNIGLKCIISDYNKGHVIHELHTQGELWEQQVIHLLKLLTRK